MESPYGPPENRFQEIFCELTWELRRRGYKGDLRVGSVVFTVLEKAAQRIHAGEEEIQRLLKAYSPS